MAGFEIMPAHPAALAGSAAEAMTDTSFRVTPHDEQVLSRLDSLADDLGFVGRQYFVASHRALSIPVSFEADKPAQYVSFMRGLQFEGDFVAHSKVLIGRIIGGNAVRALCLTFNEVTLLPYFDSIPPDHLLHVPVLAVASMQTYAA